MLTERNVSKYYPKTNETIKGHMNQNRKNVQSTKLKQVPCEIAEYPEIRGKKILDVYILTYEVRETIIPAILHYPPFKLILHSVICIRTLFNLLQKE